MWDITAAEKAGLPSIGLRCGGFGEAELLDAGAAQVFRDPQDLLDHLDETVARASPTVVEVPEAKPRASKPRARGRVCARTRAGFEALG